MRKDILIKVNSKTSRVILPTSRLGLNYENLQGNIIISFEDQFVDGNAILEIRKKSATGYLSMQKVGETYTLPILSSLLNEVGKIDMQIKITEAQDGEHIPIWKSNIFYLEVSEALNTEAEIPDEYPNWVDIVNSKLQYLENKVLVNMTYSNNVLSLIFQDGTNLQVTIEGGTPSETIQLITSDGNTFVTSDDANFIVKESD